MVVHHYFPRDVRVRREAMALAKAGWDVTVVCLKKDSEPVQDDFRGIKVYRQNIKRHRGSRLFVYLAEYLAMTSRSAMEVARLVAKERFDIVHVHTPPDFLALASVFAIATGAKLVVDIHDLTPELYSERFSSVGGAAAQLVLEAAERTACSMSSRVITVTEVFRDRLVARGVAPEKITVLRNCPDEEIFTPGRSRTALGSNGFKVIHHGTLVKRYGLEILLEAFGRLLSVVPRATLDIFGEGDMEPFLRKRAGSTGFGGRVRFHGDVLQDELVGFLSGADLCVVPNLDDGFTDMLLPTKLLEALRMGCPTIASRTSMIARVFDEDEVHMVAPGNVEDLANAMIFLATNPVVRTTLGNRGRKASERFLWTDEKTKLLQLYDSLLA